MDWDHSQYKLAYRLVQRE